MDAVGIKKAAGSKLTDKWFDGVNLPLNPDLVAIIGNKGSGKSAIADVIALLGNSQERKFFSFLKPDRFRGKAGEPARQFEGTLSWLAGEANRANLSEDPATDRVELVRYIPQGRFEALCNEHVTGRSEAFERELRAVVFSHIPADARLGALNFDQLIEAQERVFRAKLGEARKELAELNREIVGIEEQLHPDIKQNLEEQLRLKSIQLTSLEAAKPASVTEPSDDLTPSQQAASTRLQELATAEAALADREVQAKSKQSAAATKRNAAREVGDRLDLLATQVTAARRELANALATLGLTLDNVLTVTVDKSLLDKATADATTELDAVARELSEIASARAANIVASKAAAEALNEPQRQFQAYQTALKEWEQRVAAVVGSETVPDSKKGLERRLEQIAALPAALDQKRTERRQLSSKIFEVLSAQRDARSALFAPLQQVIAENQLIREDYKLQFKAGLAAFSEAISENLFSIVKQNVGDLRGEDESRQAVKTRLDQNDLDTSEGALAFIDQMHSLLHDSARRISAGGAGIDPMMRKDRQPTEAYDYIFGLEYLEPKYTLLFQDTQIEQLSPGQRGALLLIFYLLVDKGRNPILLDQPEENLDNETIVSLLVPVLSEAKQHRQIVMVTHNPNLAVVCDAEQIVYAEFDRKAASTIRYVSGSIENSTLNCHAVNVLEGTKPAFDNRGQKYHPAPQS
jgi:ABC-type lipoprotein export system ATPase subunit